MGICTGCVPVLSTVNNYGNLNFVVCTGTTGVLPYSEPLLFSNPAGSWIGATYTVRYANPYVGQCSETTYNVITPGTGYTGTTGGGTGLVIIDSTGCTMRDEFGCGANVYIDITAASGLLNANRTANIQLLTFDIYGGGVTHVATLTYSGARTATVKMRNAERVTPCGQQFTTYLQAIYSIPSSFGTSLWSQTIEPIFLQCTPCTTG
jgi:hypothetical protein